MLEEAQEEAVMESVCTNNSYNLVPEFVPKAHRYNIRFLVQYK